MNSNPQPWETFSIDQILDLDSNSDGAPIEKDSGQQKNEKMKNYQRYPKPPYSYLAMIALVIQSAPDKRLKLSEILEKISEFFPLFNGEYKGWKDSIRHNLSSNACFRKVLKDPHNPQAKGNFWTVDVSRIPPEAMMIQNTAVSRQDTYPHDLAPFIIHGHPYRSSDYNPHPLPNTELNIPGQESAAQASSSAPDPASCFPTILWHLPASHSKYVPSNVVAPPSTHPLVLYPNFPSLPLYKYPSPSYSNPSITSYSNPHLTPYSNLPFQNLSSLRPQLPLTPRRLEFNPPFVALPPNISVFDIPGYLKHAGNVPQQGP
ncbi:forkhead activin signal transducer 3-like [Anomaloglossus baeobatrachus]